MVIGIIILGIGLIGSLGYIFLMRRDLKQINQQLDLIKESDNNIRLTTTTFNKEVVTLASAVNEILNKQRDLIMTNERTNQEFKQGLTNISHDLRTPLTSVIGYTQMLQAGELDGEKEAEYLRIIENRLLSLTGLMKELFDYTKIMEGKIKIDLQKINLSNLLRDQLMIFYDQLTAQNFQVSIQLPDEDIFIISDLTILERSFQNLLKNVIAHGKDHFDLRLTPDKIVFTNKVTNLEGLDLERIFERFYTTDAFRNSKRTGLGLPITQKLLEQTGNTLKVNLEGDKLSFMIAIQSHPLK